MTQVNIPLNHLSAMQQESDEKIQVASGPFFVRTSLSPSENYLQYLADKQRNAQTRTKMN